jgi:hypothetical protein
LTGGGRERLGAGGKRGGAGLLDVAKADVARADAARGPAAADGCESASSRGTVSKAAVRKKEAGMKDYVALSSSVEGADSWRKRQAGPSPTELV